MNLPEDPVYSTRYSQCFYFFWMVVRHTNCSRKNFEKCFGPKKVDFVLRADFLLSKKNFFLIFFLNF
jgi:hypothetical protein